MQPDYTIRAYVMSPPCNAYLVTRRWKRIATARQQLCGSTKRASREFRLMRSSEKTLALWRLRSVTSELRCVFWRKHLQSAGEPSRAAKRVYCLAWPALTIKSTRLHHCTSQFAITRKLINYSAKVEPNFPKTTCSD